VQPPPSKIARVHTGPFERLVVSGRHSRNDYRTCGDLSTAANADNRDFDPGCLRM